MKLFPVCLIALSLLSCNQVVEKEPTTVKKADTIIHQTNNQSHSDTLKPLKLQNESELLLDSAQLTNLVLCFNYDDQFRIIPEIKMYAIRQPYDHFSYQKEYFYYSISGETAYSISDTLIISGMAEGESGSTILTAWKKEGDKYRFISVMEKSLKTYGYIDSVFNLVKNKYLIAGMTEWADGGDGAGSIWFAVWELPASFRMIYYDKWSATIDDGKRYSYNYSFHDNWINLEKLVVNYKITDDYQSSNFHTDWKATKSIIKY